MPETTFTEDEIRAEIKRLVANVTEREPEEISDTAHYMDELGVDSLMAMEVMIAVQKKYKIELPEEEFQKASNVNESVAMVQDYLAKRGNAAIA